MIRVGLGGKINRVTWKAFLLDGLGEMWDGASCVGGEMRGIKLPRRYSQPTGGADLREGRG